MSDLLGTQSTWWSPVSFSAPHENGVAFGETFPSNICCLLTVICYHLGRVYFPLQPARNMKFASGSLDFILSYFSVFSGEKKNLFPAVLSLVLEVAAVWSCHLAGSLPVSTSLIAVRLFFCSSPCSSSRDSQQVLTACQWYARSFCSPQCHVLCFGVSLSADGVHRGNVFCLLQGMVSKGVQD